MLAFLAMKGLTDQFNQSGVLPVNQYKKFLSYLQVLISARLWVCDLPIPLFSVVPANAFQTLRVASNFRELYYLRAPMPTAEEKSDCLNTGLDHRTWGRDIVTVIYYYWTAKRMNVMYIQKTLKSRLNSCFVDVIYDIMTGIVTTWSAWCNVNISA